MNNRFNSKLVEAAKNSNSIIEFFEKINTSFPNYFSFMFFNKKRRNEILTILEEHLIENKMNEKKLPEPIRETKNVIDTSIINAFHFSELIYKLEKEGIVFTSVVRRELNNLQFLDSYSATNARYLLRIASEKPEHYESINIDNKNVFPGDEEILQYCIKLQQSYDVILHTCDKNFALEARENGIKSIFYKTNFQKISPNLTLEERSYINSYSSLSNITMSNAKLMITNMYGERHMFQVITGSYVHSYKNSCLQINDDILMLIHLSNGYMFTHFKVVSSHVNKCCKIIFRTKLEDLNDLTLLNNVKKYINFIDVYRKTHCY